ncbi:hypothetical protein CTM70_19225, partial [Photobacterium phosphoreum]
EPYRRQRQMCIRDSIHSIEPKALYQFRISQITFNHQINHIKIKIILRVIIRHLGREARTIRDLFITRLSIKGTNETN